MSKPLPLAYLNSILNYDPTSGKVTWLVARNGYDGGVRPGDVAGHLAPSGYVLIGVDGKLYRAHRLVWQMFHGLAPKGFLDHINGVRHDNRIDNLRLSSVPKNAQNLRAAHRDSATGYLGVYKYGATRFMSKICLDGKIYKLGVFDTPQLAHSAYVDAKRRLHEHGTL